MTKHENRRVLWIAVPALIVLAAPALCTSADITRCKRQTAGAPSNHVSLTYPYHAGKLSFPQDEGKHLQSEWPFTLIEWNAHYIHLTAEDGSTYFLFTTFVTYDPIEKILRGIFPHTISTLIDLTNGKTYHHRDMRKLKRFARGHADVETAKGDYFKWKGKDKPFQYDFHVAWHDSQVDYSADLAIKMVKPPLVVNGTGYIQLPKGHSGYYSQTRLKAAGHLTINGARKKVTGIQWIDRQWLGTSFVGNIHYSYEWWALQLDNNEEAIMFRIWDINSDAIAMTLLEINHADGKREHVDGFTLTDLPSGWHLSAPQTGWDLTIVPALKGQHTWHSCKITGTIKGKPVTGVGTAELARKVVRELLKELSQQSGRSDGWRCSRTLSRRCLALHLQGAPR